MIPTHPPRLPAMHHDERDGRIGMATCNESARCGTCERAPATGRLLEHPAEVAHRLHPIRSIEPRSIEHQSEGG
jgi:hypothetical protein